MNGDERFDQLLRSALQWQADEAAQRVSSLERSVRKLADRIGHEPQQVEPLVVGRTGSGRGVQLVFAVLLLVALLAAALAIGSLLLPRPIIEPPRFGFERPCISPELDGIVYAAIVDETPHVLYQDGRFIALLAAAGEARSAILDTAGGIERRLAPRGIELILARVAETLPEPGCRSLRASTSTGQINVTTPSGPIELTWHPSNSGRRLTEDEEAEAEALELALSAPHTWLPDEAWIDPAERRVAPDEWLVMVELTPSGFAPGDVVPLSTGGQLDGSDPRYGRIVLPDGQEPAELGTEVAVRDGTSVRCAVLGTDDARRLSDSLDALGVPNDPDAELFTEDLTSRVFIYVATSYPAVPDCAAAGQNAQPGQEPPPTPAPTLRPEDDLADTDPCTLIPASIDAILGSDVRREVQPSFVSLDAPALACVLLTGAEFAPSTRHAVITLYPRSVSAESAATLAAAILGGGVVEEPIAGRSAWVNECFAAGLPCSGSIAARSGPYLLIVDFPGEFPGSPSTTTLESARSMVETVLRGLPE